jgi:hypothetical protein
MAKRHGNTLLEVLPPHMRTNRSDGRRVGAPIAQPPSVEGDERVLLSNPLGWLSPGRTIRLPVGYVFIAAAVVIFIGVASYLFGYKIGRERGQTEQAQLLARYGSPVAEDPLNLVNGTDPNPQRSSVPVTREDGRTGTGQPAGEADGTAPDGDTPDEATSTSNNTPRRERGLNYWIVASYPRDAAQRLADFLQSQGVASEVVPVDNATSQVWALPGFSRELLRSSQARDFEQRLRRLGRVWMNEHRGGDDLGSMYLKKY